MMCPLIRIGWQQDVWLYSHIASFATTAIILQHINLEH